MLKYLLIACIAIEAVTLTEASYYEILGVSKQATLLEIRQAYKKLAIKLHPDKNPDATNQERFLKVTEAYETLKDPDKRHKYDLYGLFPSYSRKYNHKSQAEYDNLYYKGLYHDDPFVDTISGNNFNDYIKDGFYFINFYSPFCPPCQNLAEHWKKLAEVFKGVVNIGAVNCKYHNSFCYNSMKISSYPTLLYFRNGKNGNFDYYRGDLTFDALDAFLMNYLKIRFQLPLITEIRSADKPIAYVLKPILIGINALMRIAFQLDGLVSVEVVDTFHLNEKVTSSNSAAVVLKYNDTSTDIEITEEKELLKAIVNQLPNVDLIDPVKLQTYRTKLRAGSSTPLVMYFSTEESDRLEFHKKQMSMPDMHFGILNCDEWLELCGALHVHTWPAWGVLKRGGAYQRVEPASIPLALAAQATNLHTLSVSEFTRILEADKGIWVLRVIPYKMSRNDIIEPFTRASIHFKDSNIHFGIMSCTAQTEQYCRLVTSNEPAVMLQNGTKRAFYSDRASEHELIDFILALKDSAEMELSVEQVLEIADVSSRTHSWLVAHMPAHCGLTCDHLTKHWVKVYTKLRPLEFVRVGILKCDTDAGGFCANIRIPTARFYPLASAHHSSVNLQQLDEAAYMLEWALGRIDESMQMLNWRDFTRSVIAEELNPTSSVKPWLIYFHSPKCYQCHEMYPDFAIAGIKLRNAVKLGRVNCLMERGLCQHESIVSYPSLRLYITRSVLRVSSVVTIQVRDHKSVLADVKKHLEEYSGNSFAVSAKHDEF